VTKETKASRLERELHKCEQEKRLYMGQNNKLYDRMKLAGLYVQCLRLMPSYTNKPGLGIPSQKDYDRILNILGMDDYPEGF
jgi:intergrase/recombinase